MAKLVLAPNVPVPFDIAYADLIDSQFGVQLRLKGRVPGDPSAVLYVDIAHADEALRAAGVIATSFDVPDPIPERGLNVKGLLAGTKVVVAKEQAAGQKTGHFTCRLQGGAPAVTAPASSPAAPNGATAGSGGAQVGRIYLECVDFVLKKVQPRLSEAGIEMVDETVIAAVATLFIQRMRG